MISGSVRGGIMLFLAVVGCTGNMFVILVVAVRRRLHTMHNFLLASLSLSDFLFHVFTIFITFSHISERWLFGIVWCKGNYYLLLCLTYITTLLLCAITWECHTAIVTPYDFSGYITAKKITVVVLLWIASFVCGAVPFFGWEKFVYNDKLHRCERDFKGNTVISSFATIVLFFVIPFGFIAKQQYQISRIAKLQRSQTAQQLNAINSDSADGQQLRRMMTNLKESKDALIVIAAFVISYLPVCVTMVLRKRLPESEKLYDAWFFVLILCQAGATWNPFIYCFRKKRFRRELLLFLGINSFKRVAPQVIQVT